LGAVASIDAEPLSHLVQDDPVSATEFWAMSKNVQQEREREWTIVTVTVSNFLHDERWLDPGGIGDELGFTIDTTLDGDIPVRININKKCGGPVELEWELWPGDAGRRTRGNATIHRLSRTKAILLPGFYERSIKRSRRLAKITVPDAKWGLGGSMLEKCGIETTY
jgi:hypothetical protein